MPTFLIFQFTNHRNKLNTVSGRRLTKGMFAPHNFRKNGRIALYNSVPDDVTDHLRSLARIPGNYWINDTVDGIRSDPLRFRPFVPDATARASMIDLQRQYRTFIPEGTASEWSFLKTIAGAEDQHARRVFSPVDIIDSADASSVPGLIFVAIEDNTYFYGYGWNSLVAMKSERKLIELNKGDILVCRGDFIYAGVGYATNNVVVRGFIDTPMYQRDTYQPPTMIAEVDDSRPKPDPFCFVWRCPFVGTDDNSLRKHVNRYHRFYFRGARATDE